MRRIRLALQYDGSTFEGWQVQPSGTTIQGLLQDCIFRLTGERVKVIGAGRTDAGVHAIEQVAAFDSGSGLRIDVIKRALNAMLPQDIRVMDAKDVEGDFHPRYSARAKCYVYMLANMRDVPVFMDRYVWWITCPLDLEAMRAASASLMGRHDFTSFRGSGCGAKNPVRTVHSLEVEKFSEAAFLFAQFRGEFIKITVEADAFLRHMVRNMVGTLVEAGRGRLSPERVRVILESRDRRLAGPTAPAKGLFLEKVSY
ncbi:MAG: tRNA pseudouridine(38-40) synthase TruA [Nitrospirae bacterium]|nr:tRNA pseudouridine(38-40) synthase TruA [Nitrospirota bacterium]MCL5422929.1 tRNA pseudouridine(38-40) synthase TruA [Nitrospirota bacterium]